MDRRNRSHPSLIQPLTTIPTSPSSSYIYPTAPSLPTMPSLLSRNTSQNTSLSRFRPSISYPQPAGNTNNNTKPRPRSRGKKSARSSNVNIGGNADGEEWLTRTASAVTMIGLEERGATWLVNRRSSTSLLDGRDGDGDEDGEGEGEGDEKYYSPEWRGSRGGSRKHSQMGSARGSRSRFGSRRESNTMGAKKDGADVRDDMEKEGGEAVGPDFVDVDEEDEEGDGGAEGEVDVVDEGEMRRIVRGKLGGWVDWAVGWMDFRGDGEEEEEEEEEEEGNEGDGDEGDEVFGKEEGGKGEGKEGLDIMELQKRLRRRKKLGRDEDENVEEGDGSGNGEIGIVVTPPPQGENVGVWSDARWLLGVATKVVL